MNYRKPMLATCLVVLTVLVVYNFRPLFGVAPPWPDLPGQAYVVGNNHHTISWFQARTINQDLALVKFAYSEYYATQGLLPRKMSEAGAKPPSYIRARNNGTIEVLVEGNPAARIYWRPRPTIVRMEWDCISPDVVNVGDRLDHCRYDPAYKPDLPVLESFVVNHRVLFDFNRAGQNGASEQERNSLRRFLSTIAAQKSYHVSSVQITGYADPMGPAALNIRLAEGRAAYVRETVAATGIHRELISVRVIGIDPRPIRSCSSSLPRNERINCYAASRRVDIAISGQREL